MFVSAEGETALHRAVDLVNPDALRAVLLGGGPRRVPSGESPDGSCCPGLADRRADRAVAIHPGELREPRRVRSRRACRLRGRSGVAIIVDAKRLAVHLPDAVECDGPNTWGSQPGKSRCRWRRRLRPLFSGRSVRGSERRRRCTCGGGPAVPTVREQPAVRMPRNRTPRRHRPAPG